MNNFRLNFILICTLILLVIGLYYALEREEQKVDVLYEKAKEYKWSIHELDRNINAYQINIELQKDTIRDLNTIFQDLETQLKSKKLSLEEKRRIFKALFDVVIEIERQYKNAIIQTQKEQFLREQKQSAVLYERRMDSSRLKAIEKQVADIEQKKILMLRQAFDFSYDASFLDRSQQVTKRPDRAHFIQISINVINACKIESNPQEIYLRVFAPDKLGNPTKGIMLETNSGVPIPFDGSGFPIKINAMGEVKISVRLGVPLISRGNYKVELSKNSTQFSTRDSKLITL